MNSEQQEAIKKPSKKPYQKPSLKVYGNLDTLTKTVANVSPTMDGGTGGTNKTH